MGLSLRNIVPIVCGQEDSFYTNMVASTLQMKSGLGEGQGGSEAEVPRRRYSLWPTNVYYS